MLGGAPVNLHLMQRLVKFMYYESTITLVIFGLTVVLSREY